VDVITLASPYVARDELTSYRRRSEVRAVHTLTDRSPDGLGLVGTDGVRGSPVAETGRLVLIEVSPDRARHRRVRVAANGFEGRAEHDGSRIQR
jgi:hypothetical protein